MIDDYKSMQKRMAEQGASSDDIYMAVLAAKDRYISALQGVIESRDAQIAELLKNNEALKEGGLIWGDIVGKLNADIAELSKAMASINKLFPCDYVLVDDMDEGFDDRYGKVLVCTQNCIKEKPIMNEAIAAQRGEGK